MTDYAYEGVRRVVYGEGATFVPVCPKCGRFVKADDSVETRGWQLVFQPNATCSKCGRVEMPFEGYIGDEE